MDALWLLMEKRLICAISRTNVASVGSVFHDTQKVKVLSLPETIKEKSTFRAKALRLELVVGGVVGSYYPPTTNSRRRAFARNVDFSLSFQVVREPLPFG